MSTCLMMIYFGEATSRWNLREEKNRLRERIYKNVGYFRVGVFLISEECWYTAGCLFLGVLSFVRECVGSRVLSVGVGVGVRVGYD